METQFNVEEASEKAAKLLEGCEEEGKHLYRQKITIEFVEVVDIPKGELKYASSKEEFEHNKNVFANASTNLSEKINAWVQENITATDNMVVSRFEYSGRVADDLLRSVRH